MKHKHNGEKEEDPPPPKRNRSSRLNYEEKEREEKKKEDDIDDRHVMDVEKEDVAPEMQTDTDQRVVTASLMSLFLPTKTNTPATLEHARRSIVGGRAIRYAAETISKINHISNKVMTEFSLDLVKTGQRIPLRLGTDNQTMWNWSRNVCTIFKDEGIKDTWPTSRKEYTRHAEEERDTNTPLTELEIKKGRKNAHKETKGREKNAKKEEKRQKTVEKARIAAEKKRVAVAKEEERLNKLKLNMSKMNDNKRRQAEEKERQRQLKNEIKAQKDAVKQDGAEARAKEAARRVLQKGAIARQLAQEMTFEYQTECYRQIKETFENKIRPLLPELPDRYGLDKALHEESKKRMFEFRNLYGTTFLSRQRKVVRNQVDNIPLFGELELDDKKTRARLRWICTNIVVSKINRWSNVDYHVAALKAEWTSMEDLDDMMRELHALVVEHQSAFGPSLLTEPFYMLSAEDATAHPSLYVYYFHYFSLQYARFDAMVKEARISIRSRWRPFPIMPQLKYQVSFIDLGAQSIIQLANMTRLPAFKDYMMADIKDMQDWTPYDQRELDLPSRLNPIVETIKQRPSIDWLGTDATLEWAVENGMSTFDRLFSSDDGMRSGWRKLIHKTERSKYKQTGMLFYSRITTDGQQVKVHYTTQQRVKKTEAHGEEISTISEELFQSWVKDKKTLISVDPGHADIISAVRHYPPSQLEESKITPPRPTTRKGKQKWAKRQRLAEAHQSLYSLSNKAYYEMCGMTTANKTRYRWRKEAGLTLLDEQLSRDFVTCRQRSWDPDVYHNYVKTMLGKWSDIWKEVTKRKYSKLRFRVFQQKQRTHAKIAHDLTEGNPLGTKILWGAGGFGPTSRGHAAAPNKLMRKNMKDHQCEIYLIREDYSSQKTPCCHVNSVYAYQEQSRRRIIGPLPVPVKKPIRGLMYCKSAHHPHPSSNNPLLVYHNRKHIDHSHINGTLVIGVNDGDVKRTSRPWNRDVASANNIAHIGCAAACGIGLHPCFQRPSKTDILLEAMCEAEEDDE